MREEIGRRLPLGDLMGAEEALAEERQQTRDLETEADTDLVGRRGDAASIGEMRKDVDNASRRLQGLGERRPRSGPDFLCNLRSDDRAGSIRDPRQDVVALHADTSRDRVASDADSAAAQDIPHGAAGKDFTVDENAIAIENNEFRKKHGRFATYWDDD